MSNVALNLAFGGNTYHPCTRAMIRLHAGSGSWEINPIGPHMSSDEWLKLRQNIVRLLQARKRPGVGLLDKLPWELYDGTNWFGDEFCFLYARVPIGQYVEVAEFEHNEKAKVAAKALANAFEELGTPIRFIAFEPVRDSTPSVVPAPTLKPTAAATSRALNDAARLLETNGPVSAVDRVHTALHGYLRELCAEAKIDIEGADGATALWKRLRSGHPGLSRSGPQAEHVSRIVGGIATILDALNRCTESRPEPGQPGARKRAIARRARSHARSQFCSDAASVPRRFASVVASAGDGSSWHEVAQ